MKRSARVVGPAAAATQTHATGRRLNGYASTEIGAVSTGWLLAGLVTAAVVVDVSAAPPVRVSLAAKPASPVARRTWTAKLAVRPTSYRGAVDVTATGSRRIDARANGGDGAYSARLVFPAAGHWTLAARAGGTTSPLGSVQVRPAPARPVAFTTETPAFRLAASGGPPVRVAAGLSNPHRLALATDGALLISDTANDRLLRIEPSSGASTTLAQVGSPRGLDVAADGSIDVVDSIAGASSTSRRPARGSATSGRLSPCRTTSSRPAAVPSTCSSPAPPDGSGGSRPTAPS